MADVKLTPRSESTTFTYKPSNNILNFIKKYETFVPYVYDDKAERTNGKPTRYQKGTPVKGKLTIGYGETDKNIINKHLGGPDITEALANQYFQNAVDKRIPTFVNSTPNASKRNQNQLDALFSYYYNIGHGSYTTKSKNMQAALSSMDDEAVARNIDFGMNQSGMGGLRKRREEEQALYRKPVDTPRPKLISREVSRQPEPTPQPE